MMKLFYSLKVNCFFFFALFLVSTLSAQEYKNLDYHCLDTTFFLEDPQLRTTHINCIDGTARVDTVDPCLDFYEEDRIRLRSWYFYGPDQGTSTEIFFGEMSLKEEAYFEAYPTKYFDLKQSGIWFLLSRFPGEVERLRIRVADISGGGVNLGLNRMNNLLPHFDSFASIPADFFEGFQITYDNEYLIIEGAVENLEISGDHLYLSNIEINATTTSTTTAREAGISIFPNPLTDRLQLRGTSLDGSILTVTDIAGRPLAHQQVQGAQGELNFEAYAAGLYMVSARKDGQLLFVEKIQKY